MPEVVQIIVPAPAAQPIVIQTIEQAPAAVLQVVEPGARGPRGLPGPMGPPDTLAEEEIAEHLADPTPHPAYDDQPDLVLIFENHLI